MVLEPPKSQNQEKEKEQDLSFADIQKLLQSLPRAKIDFLNAYLNSGLDLRVAKKQANISHNVAVFWMAEDEALNKVLNWYLERFTMPAQEALARLSNIARGDLSAFFRPLEPGDPAYDEFIEEQTLAKGWNANAEEEIDLTPIKNQRIFDLDAALAEGMGPLIKKIRFDSDGNLINFEVHDAHKALKDIAAAHGIANKNQVNNQLQLEKERSQQSQQGPVTNIQINYNSLPNEALLRIANGEPPAQVMADFAGQGQGQK